MAKCEQCGRGPQYGNNRPWSRKATRRTWSINVQMVQVFVAGMTVSFML